MAPIHCDRTGRQPSVGRFLRVGGNRADMGNGDGDRPSVGNRGGAESDVEGMGPLRMAANGAAVVEFLALVCIAAGGFNVGGARSLLVGVGALCFGLALLVGAVVAFLDDTHSGITALLALIGAGYTGAGVGVLTGMGPTNLAILVAYATVGLLFVAVVVVGVVAVVQLTQG